MTFLFIDALQRYIEIEMEIAKAGFRLGRSIDRALWTAERTEARIRRARRTQKQVKNAVVGHAEKKEQRRKEKEDPGPTGTLFLTLIEGRDLPIADMSGASDPYVKIRVGGTKKKTKVIHKTLEPRWDEKFVFDVTFERYFVLKVMDRDRISKDDKLGRCTVQLAPYENGVAMDRWFRLDTKGEIHLSIQFVVEARKAAGAPRRPPKPALPVQYAQSVDRMDLATSYTQQVDTAAMSGPPLPPGRSQQFSGPGGLGVPEPQHPRRHSDFDGWNGAVMGIPSAPVPSPGPAPQAPPQDVCVMCGAPAASLCMECRVLFCSMHDQQHVTSLPHRLIALYPSQQYGGQGQQYY